MNEGDNFGTVNGGSGQPDNNIPYNSDPFGQPTTPIMSSPDAAAGQENVSAAPNNNVGVDQGNIPVVSTEGMSNTSKFFGGRARRAFNRNVDTQQQNFLAAQNIASNPNTPQFFSDAVISDNPMPIASPGSKSKKPIIIGGIIAALITIAIVCVVVLAPWQSTDNDIPKEFSDIVKKYVTQIVGEEYKDNLNSNNVNYDLDYSVVTSINSHNRKNADKYYESTDKLLSAMSDKIESGNNNYNNIDKVITQSEKYLFFYYETSKVIFIETGKEYSIDTLKTIANNLKKNKKSFDDGKNGYGTTLYDILLSYINNKIEVLLVYKNNNCINNNNDLDYNCAEKIDFDNYDSILDSSHLLKQIEAMHQSNKNIIISGAYRMNTIMEESND